MSFREETRAWIEDNFPPSLKGLSLNFESPPSGDALADLETWRARLADQGWGAPTWPTEYGGAGLSQADAKIIAEEMAKVGAFKATFKDFPQRQKPGSFVP